MHFFDLAVCSSLVTGESGEDLRNKQREREKNTKFRPELKEIEVNIQLIASGHKFNLLYKLQGVFNESVPAMV